MMTSSGIYIGQGSDTPHPQDKPVYGSLRDYWNDMSNGQVVFTGGVWNASGGTINWVVLDHNKMDYHNNTYNFRSEVLAKSGYSQIPGPNRIRVMIYAGNQYLGGGGLHPSSTGYEYIDSEEFGRPQGQEWSFPTQFFNNIGTACHEMGHAAFGFPDRYLTYNTLQWDLMGIGNKNGPGNELACPATLNPFDRQSENWISFQSFSGTQSAKSFAYSYSSPQIFQVAVSGNEYFLIENRRNQNGGGGPFDLWLPEQGILVWHVRNSTGAGTINLIEADNSQSEASQSGDPFPGVTNNTNLNDFTTPNSKFTTGTNSQMILHYISSPSMTMTADLGSKWFGNLPLNLTWAGTVRVGGNLTVPNGKTLTNAAGNLVQFDAGTSLTINGTLTVNGTQTQPVTFDRSGASGTWNGIRFYSGSSGTITYATIDHATKGVYVSGTNNVTVANSTIKNFTEQGVYATNSSVTVQSSTIQNPAGASHGIYLLGGSSNPTITSNTIKDALIGIERKDNPGAATIAGNTFTNCRDGVKAISSSPEIYNNYFDGMSNAENGIRIGTSSSPNIHDNDFFDYTIGVYLEQNQPSNLKWNNFGYTGGQIKANEDRGIVVNYLTSGNGFLNNKWNNFYDGSSAVDIFNNISTTLNAQGNYWYSQQIEGNVDSSNPQTSHNNDAGPGGGLGKIAAADANDVSPTTLTFPETFGLEQNFPNPFNPGTVIGFKLPEASIVTLTIYDLLGRRVRTLISGFSYEPGFHNLAWDGTDDSGQALASGIYIYQIEAKSDHLQRSYSESRKLLFTR